MEGTKSKKKHLKTPDERPIIKTSRLPSDRNNDHESDGGMRLMASYLVPMVFMIGAVVLFIFLVRGVEIPTPQENSNTVKVDATKENLKKELKTVLPKEDTVVNVLQELQIISLVDRTGQGFFGNASREMRDGLFSVSAVANLSDPEEGLYYEAWIQRTYPFQMITMGRMAKNQQGRYAINYGQEKNLLDFENLVITKERDDQNPSPSDLIILEGNFSED